MKWLCLVLVAALAGCSTESPPAPNRVDAARDALRMGDVQRAHGIIDEGLSAASAHDAADLELRLLRAEIFLAQRRTSDAHAALSVINPDNRGPRFQALHKYLAARVLALQGDPDGAVAVLETAREAGRNEADVLLDIEIFDGQMKLQRREWAEGEAVLEAVVARASASGDRYRQAVSYGNLGMSRYLRNRYEEALSWFDRVLEFHEFEQFPVYAAALTNAATCYTRLGQFDRARHALAQALTVYQKRGASAELLVALDQIGLVFLLENRPRDGLEYWHRALQIAAEAAMPVPPLTLANLSEAYVGIEDWDAAERFNEMLRAAVPSDRLPATTYAQTAARIALGRGDTRRARELFNRRLDEASTGFARWASYSGLADVALAEERFAEAAAHFESALGVIEATRSDLQRTDYQISFLSELITFYRSYVGALMRQDRSEDALVVADSSRGRVLAERHGVGAGRRTNAAALREAARRSGRTLLSYWVTPAQSYVWVVTPQSIRTATLPGAGEIERLVREHRSNMESSLLDLLTAAPGTAADRLFDMLVAPISRWLPEDGALVIVPDGPLHALNFETLTTSDPSGQRRYWIEDFEIQIAPSLAILGAQRPSSAQPAARAVSTVRGERTPSLLLVGNSEPQGREFPALRYARTEMAGISAHFSPEAVAVYQGAEAVPAAYREARPERFSMIHFTAHATANVDSPLDSAVILSGPPDRFRLTARDVAEQKLNAELVTVSACRSAGERAYSGEGLIGFAWAFLRAGSKRVVAGLWDVDDRSTATLMNSFYARLANGVRPAQALREAKLELIESGVTKPYYWAPLQMFTVVPQ